jgi:hypothetical protein
MNQIKPCFRTNGAEFQTGTQADEEGAYSWDSVFLSLY